MEAARQSQEKSLTSGSYIDKLFDEPRSLPLKRMIRILPPFHALPCKNLLNILALKDVRVKSSRDGSIKLWSFPIY